MCPIETPEGPNIGLITSLACYAQVNDLGFVETPYRVVKNGKVTADIEWLDANREEDVVIAQANARLNEDGTFVDELVLCRQRGDVPLVAPERIDYMDVAPEQLVSIAAALIPFLEHDDANRALMGSNMQRQAVPLLNPRTPLVGTGLEEKVARDSGAVVIARRAGTITSVTADEIIVGTGASERGKKDSDRPLARLTQHDRYRLKKYWRTNQDTALNQRPMVKAGQKVKAGEVLADGASTEMGQLALGANVTVAFMPWYGHNFEDAIVLSERLVKDDVYSSIHIQELELHVRDTKRGQEEITREIPNVAEEALSDLDERGIVRIGAHVKPGDILVGKITPKGQTVSLARKSGRVEEGIPSGTELTAAMLREMKLSSLDLKTFRVEDKKMNERVRTIIDLANDEKAKLEEKAEERIDRVLQPDELPPGVIQLVKVYMAEKRKVSVGDKMAGRHGNKGIVARIVPEEDMPFLPYGRPVDIVLNPLGVPSRMNVGQILETHLGWAARLLGFYAKTPVFQGANEREIGLLLKLAAVTWVRDALDLKVPGVRISDAEIRGIIADVGGANKEGRIGLLHDATIDSLSNRGVSAETRDVYNRIRDFVTEAARELAGRDVAETDNQIAFHTNAAGDEEYEPTARAQYKIAGGQIEKKRNTDPSSILASQELPALAEALSGKKSDVDVDAAAMELMR